MQLSGQKCTPVNTNGFITLCKVCSRSLQSVFQPVFFTRAVRPTCRCCSFISFYISWASLHGDVLQVTCAWLVCWWHLWEDLGKIAAVSQPLSDDFLRVNLNADERLLSHVLEQWSVTTQENVGKLISVQLKLMHCDHMAGSSPRLCPNHFITPPLLNVPLNNGSMPLALMGVNFHSGQSVCVLCQLQLEVIWYFGNTLERDGEPAREFWNKRYCSHISIQFLPLYLGQLFNFKYKSPPYPFKVIYFLSLLVMGFVFPHCASNTVLIQRPHTAQVHFEWIGLV